MEFTPEQLEEALYSDAGIQLIGDLVEARLAQEREAFDEQREVARWEARAESERRIQLRDMRDEAEEAIQEAKLPPKMTERLKDDYALKDGFPAAKLDRVDEVSDEGEVVKSANEIVRESVQEDIKAAREILAEANPTRIEGQGPTTETDEGEPKTPKREEKPYWQEMLAEAGIEKPDEAYA